MHGVRSTLDLYDGARRWDELIELTRRTRRNVARSTLVFDLPRSLALNPADSVGLIERVTDRL